MRQRIFSMLTLFVAISSAVNAGSAGVVLQADSKNHPGLHTVPKAIKLAKTDEGRKMIEGGIHGDSDIGRTYPLPPGTPTDRVQILRKAFESIVKDRNSSLMRKNPASISTHFHQKKSRRTSPGYSSSILR